MDKVYAAEKPEGEVVTFASPKCYVPINEPNACWWDEVKNEKKVCDIYAEMEEALVGRVYRKIGNTAHCPTGEPYRSYVWAVNASRELVEDLSGDIDRKARRRIMRALVNTVRWCLESEPDKILYWRKPPEINLSYADYDFTRVWTGYMRFVMGGRV